MRLFHEIGTDLADQGVLIAGAAAATDGADDLAAFDKRNSAGARDERRIERGDIAVAGLEGGFRDGSVPPCAPC